MTDLPVSAPADAPLPSRARRTAWLPITVAAALGFALVLGFGSAGDPPVQRLVLAVASAAVAVTILLLGQVLLALAGRQRYAFLDRLPTHEALDEDKRQVLTALKELEFDRAMNKINERDYADLKERYEAEALRVLKAIDEERSRWEQRAAEVADAHLRAVGLGATRARPAPRPAPPEPATEKAASPAAGACPACETLNDPDARFCKRCGTRLSEAA